MYTDGVSTVWILDTGEPDENAGGDNGDNSAGGQDIFDGAGMITILTISIIVLVAMCAIGYLIGKRRSD
jgi:hypothetical protein